MPDVQLTEEKTEIKSAASREKQLYYRLIALWAVCEGMLGGIIHGFKLPVSGLLVGGGAVIIICLIGYYVPARGAIIRATVLVAIFKMMLSPQSPLPAYFAVFFQGIVGELIFFMGSRRFQANRKLYHVLCIVFGGLALFESGVQRIVVMTILYGTEFWTAVNIFITGLTHQETITNYSLYLASGYVIIHIVAGILVGWMAAHIPSKVKHWQKEALLPEGDHVEMNGGLGQTIHPRKRKRIKLGLMIVWLLLIVLWVQSEFNIGNPLLSSNLVLRILVRSFLIVLTWYFLISPLITFWLKKYLTKQQARWQNTVNEILKLIPATQMLLERSWQHCAGERGIKRLNKFVKTVLVNSLL